MSRRGRVGEAKEEEEIGFVKINIDAYLYQVFLVLEFLVLKECTFVKYPGLENVFQKNLVVWTFNTIR